MNTLQWLEKLISINTISSNSNLAIIQEIKEWFELHQVTYHIIPGTSIDKVNLLAILPAQDGSINGGLLLSGHTDVVPVSWQQWDTDPFKAVIKENKVYGRGACDMKGFLAILLALVPEFKALKLSKPLYLAFTFDEEIGCIGVEFLVEFMKKHAIQPQGCIVGEPSSMRPIVGDKGRRLYNARVEGKAVHSSLTPMGCNAIEYASLLITYINKLALHTQEYGPFDYDFDIPFTSITTNCISGGNATNTIPNRCEFIVEVRYLEEFPLLNFYHQIINYINEELIPMMKQKYPDAAIFFEEISDEGGFNAAKDHPLFKIVRAVTGIQQAHKVSYGTEAGAYQNMHIPTLICGPGDIQQAHQANEFISLDQLVLCEKMLKNVVLLFNME